MLLDVYRMHPSGNVYALAFSNETPSHRPSLDLPELAADVAASLVSQGGGVLIYDLYGGSVTFNLCAISNNNARSVRSPLE